MNCNKCGKWAGAHATLPGQPRDHLCLCTPQRTWVGLTDEEQKKIADLASANDWHDFDVMDATEAKLRSKNGY